MHTNDSTRDAFSEAAHKAAFALVDQFGIGTTDALRFVDDALAAYDAAVPDQGGEDRETMEAFGL